MHTSSSDSSDDMFFHKKALHTLEAIFSETGGFSVFLGTKWHGALQRENFEGGAGVVISDEWFLVVGGGLPEGRRLLVVGH
ncbi:Uncharacterised protein [Candidatus Bartonella washoeensis]|uniref:hypothetical protein n=1 Tax=Candidatus Bartonella washoeensis TaxID=186739 RepID=UPI000D9D06F7|nr:hypothetical protein [Bartonella washoeensis]SPU26099.1 Uncharacterised protein [Bartonella washoeensis]